MTGTKEDYFEHGVGLLDAGEIDAAIEAFTSGIPLADPPDVWAAQWREPWNRDFLAGADLYAWRSIAYDFKRDYPAAIADATKVFEYFPGALDIVSHAEQPLPEVQKAFIQQMIETGLTQLEADWIFGDIERVVGRYHWRAYLYFKNGEYAKAIADLDVYLKLKPDDHESSWLRFYCYFLSRDKAGAIAAAKRVFELDNNSGPTAERARELLQEMESWPE